MPLTELMLQIQDLSKCDKLLLMQFIATELVKEEKSDVFVANQEYPVWSPYNCSEAANVLMNLLETKKQETLSVRLTGNLARHEAHAIIVNAQVSSFPRVDLAFA
ncbi:MAG: hypothetical protein J7524_17765 [Roseofilum sp. Belize BBD 4]|nr:MULTISPECIES: hypothetical protein [unclassified Roseofilum]MBP0007338.1 hypothetical protein [Roseofilum sp. Belize Diploria]MBP0034991.1 hypothetical protein [Roseofilum sp. Belize BBD 4]